MKRPNPLPPDLMTPAERRAEICCLLALGLIRLSRRNTAQLSDGYRESSLHNSADRSIHATRIQKETA